MAGEVTIKVKGQYECLIKLTTEAVTLTMEDTDTLWRWRKADTAPVVQVTVKDEALPHDISSDEIYAVLANDQGQVVSGFPIKLDNTQPTAGIAHLNWPTGVLDIAAGTYNMHFYLVFGSPTGPKQCSTPRATAAVVIPYPACAASIQ